MYHQREYNTAKSKLVKLIERAESKKVGGQQQSLGEENPASCVGLWAKQTSYWQVFKGGGQVPFHPPHKSANTDQPMF